MTPSVVAFKSMVDQWSPKVTEKFSVPYSYEYTFKALEKIGGFKFCSKCGGTGFLREYSYIQSGVCFKCNGHCLTKFGIGLAELSATVEANPEILFKVIAAKFKSEDRAKAKQEAKHIAFQKERTLRQIEAIKVLSEADQAEFLELIAKIDAIAISYHSKDGTYDASADEYLKLNAFTKELHSTWLCYGRLSEKQMLAMLNNSRKENHKAELLKSARSFTAGEKFESVIGTVTKMERVEVQTSPWATGYTTKVVLAGPNQEFFVIKTDNSKLLDVFSKSLEEKAQVTFSGTCKWVAPQGFPAVFTARGLRVTM